MEIYVRRYRILCSFLFFIALMLLLFSEFSCSETASAPKTAASHQKMLDLLAEVRQKIRHPNNSFDSEPRLAYCDSVLSKTTDKWKRLSLQFVKAGFLLEHGDEAQAVALYEDLVQSVDENPEGRQQLLLSLGTAYMRLAERNNCVNGHTSNACIMPIQGNGVHQDKTAARKAANIFIKILADDPKDLDALWLLNIAYMTLGEYPKNVPAQFLIPGLDAPGYRVQPFIDMAPDLKLDLSNRSGGSIVDDFDNDGFLDIVTTAWGLDDPMHFFKNNGDGTFTDVSEKSGLSSLTGGLNCVQTDYNNDGWLDIFVLRGAWQGQIGFGNQPNSLIRNNGDGTFTDVTTEAGLLSLHPTQTATWNDFNRDGWLDLFIANETSAANDLRPCELYINNQDGTFSNVAAAAAVNFFAFVKGVTSGDYDNDGWPDLFLSTMNAGHILLRNKGVQGGVPVFDNKTKFANLGGDTTRTFPTWFWDYDNDGWLDIFVCNYDFDRPLSYHVAREAQHPTSNMAGKPYLYRNNGDGTFANVTAKMNLNTPAFAMGANFGDIDNDGWLDMYLGTGNPNYMSLVPNKMFKNLGGQKFVDVTTSSRTGNLQKGHGVAFADLDNDGDQDIYAEMGGAYRGDAYPNAFYMNPGQGTNNWICLKLEGTKSNRAAIGAKLTIKFRENGQQRMVYREVNSGGSFGCSPLRREIGIGQATVIDEISVVWPVSGIVQTLKNVQPNQFLKVTEGKEGFEKVDLKKLVFKKADGTIPMCAPVQ